MRIGPRLGWILAAASGFGHFSPFSKMMSVVQVTAKSRPAVAPIINMKSGVIMDPVAVYLPPLSESRRDEGCKQSLNYATCGVMVK